MCCAVEWMELETGTMKQKNILIGDGQPMLTVPFAGGGRLFLRKT